jgi:4-coumarate--CoA ligase
MDPFVIDCPEASKEYDDYPSFAHVVMKNLTKAGDKILLISGITAEELSAKELLEKAINVAKSLKANGIKEGDMISLVSENRFEFAYVLFGTILMNCTIATINLTYTEREMIHAMNLSKPKIIFTSPFASEKVVNVAKTLGFVKKVILFEDENPFGNKVTMFDDFLKVTSNDKTNFNPTFVDKSKAVSVILCSSGTTGVPKGVQLTQTNMNSVARFCQNTVTKLGFNGDDEEITVLGLVPWFHAFGFTTLVGIISTISAKIVLLPKFEEGLFLGSIENYKCNLLFMVPPLMVFLAKHPLVDNFDLSSLRTIICGAAPLSADVQKCVEDRLKNPKLAIRQGYGMSELSLATMVQKKYLTPGSVGDLNEGSSVKVIDENGKSVGPKVRGELCFKSNQMMLGYVGDEKSTKQTIDDDGWLHTGDVGYYDENKQFFIVDRIKELIKWKGFQVPPAEIEGILLTNPKIKDAAVIGIPDELAGELPLAFVVKADDSLTENDVIQFVAKDASPAKKLHGGVIFIDEIPKNLSGKILRRELRELAKTKNLKSKL